MRTPLIAGNWKMNKLVKEGLTFFETLTELPNSDEVEAVICAPFTHLTYLVEKSYGSNIKIGAQNAHYEDSGAYTGEVSVPMLEDIGVSYIIIGHSERRAYFNETDEAINKKAHRILDAKITPIICVGESEAERDDGEAHSRVSAQVEKALNGLSELDVAKTVVAYEPIWAIGTGKSATKEDANEMCGEIRNTIKGLYNVEVSEQVRIQYGGSVKPENIQEYMSMEQIDGALVGGASLEPDAFMSLVNGAIYE